MNGEKIFYVAPLCGEEGIKWPTTNFPEWELKIIDKFLKELNEHAGGVTIDAIAIIDKD